jgi:D-3-phosphoglycerate dehydrogenase
LAVFLFVFAPSGVRELKILVTGVLPEFARARLEQLSLHVDSRGAKDLTEPDKFIEAIKDADFYISGGYEIASKTVLEATKELKLIAFLGVACGAYIDLPTAHRKAIAVCNTPGANALSVAEFSFGLLLAAQRRILFGASLLESKGEYKTTHSASGKTLGLVGFGNIAQQVARMGKQGFGMRVQYWTPSGAKPEGAKVGAEFTDLDNLILTSDIISLHVPNTAGTLLTADRLAKLKKGCALVCTSPASLIDLPALANVLSQDETKYAAFDCDWGVAKEKDGGHSEALKTLQQQVPNQVLITPHVAWRTFESDDATYELALGSIADFLNGAKPRNVVQGLE